MTFPGRLHGRTFALALLLMLVCALAPAAAHAVPLLGSSYDSADGNQDTGLLAGIYDWERVAPTPKVTLNADNQALDDCFIGGVKEDTPGNWNFNTSAGGCIPGKSDLIAAWSHAELAPSASFLHLAFLRNATTGNTFITFELNQTDQTWVNTVGVSIPCRSNGDLLLSYEVGGATLNVTVYRWTGDGTGPAACPDGRNGTFTNSASANLGALNAAAATNFLSPGTFGASFAAEAFGESHINLAATLASMGVTACQSYIQVQAHTRSSSSISSALIDRLPPTGARIATCGAVDGTVYLDGDQDAVRDIGEAGVSAVSVYADANDDGVRQASEPQALTDTSGYYVLAGAPAGVYPVRVLPPAGAVCPGGCAATRTFTATGNHVGVDVGVYLPASVSGSLYHDLDADGVRDPGESGVDGVSVYADADADGVHDAGEPQAASGPAGAYTLTPLSAGPVLVRVIPGAYTCSAPGCTRALTLTAGQAAAGTDVGVWLPAAVTATVYEDRDASGARDAGEPGLAGRVVYADTDGDGGRDAGEPFASTDAAGDALITNIQAFGAVTVRQELPAGWQCTAPACARAVSLSSDMTGAAGELGAWQPVTVDGVVFDDGNGDGVRGLLEAGLAGLAVFADLDADGDADAGEPQALSGLGGEYAVGGLRPGQAVGLRVLAPGRSCSAPAQCVTADTAGLSGETLRRDFATFVPATVSGRVYDDLDADGVLSAGDPGRGTRLVYADYDNDGEQDTGEPAALTSPSGAYELALVNPGSWTLRTVPAAGETCVMPAGCASGPVLATSGSVLDGPDFGTVTAANASGTLYDDVDGDGTRDAGEPGRGGVSVHFDTDGDGSPGAGEPVTVTAADGTYTLAGLTPGQAGTLLAALGAGAVCTQPAPCAFPLSPTSGQALSDLDFGAYMPASVSGVLFEDLDADGARDLGDGGRDAVVVFADTDGDGEHDAGEPAASTDAAGAYTLSGLAPGAVTVRALWPAGFTCSPACHTALTVSSGETLNGADLGAWRQASISGVVFADLDADGTRDAGEPGLGARDVYLDTDADAVKDAGEPAALTGPDGAYALAGLDPGARQARPVLAAAETCSTPVPCRADVTLRSGQAAGGTDFGVWTAASIAGTVFEDVDGDGSYGTGDRPAPNAVVFADSDQDGEPDTGEPSVLTDHRGAWTMPDLTPGQHTVRVVPAAPLSCPAACARTVTVSSAQALGAVDFAVRQPGSVQGRAFVDRDADGAAREPGDTESGYATAFVDYDGDGLRGPGEPFAVLAADGSYLITGVAPGAWTVLLDVQAGWTCSHPVSCSRDVTVRSGEQDAAGDFGAWEQASVDGRAFTDADGDGVLDPGETPRGGVVVFVDLNDNGVLDPGEPSAVTAPDGSYVIDGVRPGTVTLVEVGAGTVQLDVVSGQPVNQVNLAAAAAGPQPDRPGPQPEPDADPVAVDPVTGAIVGNVWADGGFAAWARTSARRGVPDQLVYIDADQDGRPDPGEAQRRTDQAGAYRFSALPAGRYVVRLSADRAVGWRCGAPTAGCLHDVQLAAGQEVVLRDFSGVVPQARLTIAATAGCRADRASVQVKGRYVREVAFFVDGRRVRTLRAANAGTGRYRLDVRLAGRRPGVHRVRATVRFVAASQLRSRTLRAAVFACKARPRPAYTG